MIDLIEYSSETLDVLVSYRSNVEKTNKIFGEDNFSKYSDTVVIYAGSVAGYTGKWLLENGIYSSNNFLDQLHIILFLS